MSKIKMSNQMPRIGALLVWLLLFVPFSSQALGVKEINVYSALNQPLKARIGLVSVAGFIAQDIKVKLADPKKFQEAGIGRPYFLTKLKFEPVIAADGESYISVTSRDIVREPYLNFFVEISWRDGSLIKEYAILLDPITIQQASVSKPKAEPKPPVQTPQAEPQEVYGPVKRAETLWVIAKKTRTDSSITINQMIDAIHQANPKAFVGGNVNLLKQGEMLAIPDSRTILASLGKLPETPKQVEPKPEESPTTVVAEQAEPETQAVASSTQPEAAQEAAPSPMAEQPAMEQEQPETSMEEAAPEEATTTTEEEPELKVVATPESQIEELLQSEENKAFPKGEIEQLRGSITDKEQDITALNSINQDLIKLQSALKAKIKLVQEELDKTNMAIEAVSGKMNEVMQEPEEEAQNELGTSIVASKDEAAEQEPAVAENNQQVAESETEVKSEAVEQPQPTAEVEPKPEPEPEPKPQPVQEPEPETTAEETVPAEPVTPAVVTRVITPEPADEPAGAEIKSDAAELARIKKLEQEIEALKSQGNTIFIQKMVIAGLAVAVLIAIAMILFSRRRVHESRPSHGLRTPEYDHMRPHASKYDTPAEAGTVHSITSHDENREVLFDSHSVATDEVISQADNTSDLYDQLTDDHEAEAEKYLDEEEDELLSANNMLFETSREEPVKNASSILTTVDVYLAYRRLTEAESMLHDAIGDYPESPELKAKLLEIFVYKSDKKKFTNYLERYHDQISTQAPHIWQNILTIGSKLIPGHPFLAEAIGQPANEDINPDPFPETSTPDSDVDEVVISDVPTPDDDLFRVDQDDHEEFDIDLDIDLDLDNPDKK